MRYNDEEYEDDYNSIEAIPAQSIQLYIDDDYIEVTTISDVYKTEEEEVDGEMVEKYTLVKRGVKSKQTIWKSEISHVKQMFNENGNIKTKQIELGIKYKDPIVVVGNYKEFKDLLFTVPKKEYKSIGFRYGRTL